jgi:hypothetical protein
MRILRKNKFDILFKALVNIIFFIFKRSILQKSSKKRAKKEGLNSLQYEIVKISKIILFTKLTVYYDQKKIETGY